MCVCHGGGTAPAPAPADIACAHTTPPSTPHPTPTHSSSPARTQTSRPRPTRRLLRRCGGCACVSAGALPACGRGREVACMPVSTAPRLSPDAGAAHVQAPRARDLGVSSCCAAAAAGHPLSGLVAHNAHCTQRALLAQHPNSPAPVAASLHSLADPPTLLFAQQPTNILSNTPQAAAKEEREAAKAAAKAEKEAGGGATKKPAAAKKVCPAATDRHAETPACASRAGWSGMVVSCGGGRCCRLRLLSRVSTCACAVQTLAPSLTTRPAPCLPAYSASPCNQQLHTLGGGGPRAHLRACQEAK
jgi:outer membrane biosynthesis protein TonB